MRRAGCQLCCAVRHLRRARELTDKEWIEDELTWAIRTVRDVSRQLARIRRRQCVRRVCRSVC